MWTDNHCKIIMANLYNYLAITLFERRARIYFREFITLYGQLINLWQFIYGCPHPLAARRDEELAEPTRLLLMPGIGTVCDASRDCGRILCENLLFVWGAAAISINHIRQAAYLWTLTAASRPVQWDRYLGRDWRRRWCCMDSGATTNHMR